MFDLARQVLDEIVNEWRRQAAIGQLNGLNDRLLDDIGLRREQLPTYRLEPAAREAPSRLAYRPEFLPCG